MGENIINVTEDSFNSTVIESRKPILVDFWAEWCGPCRMLSPVVEELANEYKDKIYFAKINVDDNPKLASQYGVMSIPTIIIFKNGKPEQQVVGFRPKSELKKIIDNIITS